MLLACALVLAGVGGNSWAKTPPRAFDCPTPDLLKLNERGPRPKEVASFLHPTDALTSNDKVIEIPLGQGRILTTNEPLAVAGKVALIAVGDPALLEFAVVNLKQIRILGLGIGVTDLVISTSEGKTHSFEVRVSADLTFLRAQLQRSFPDATVRLTQMREHIVVEGQARDSVQVKRIIEMIEAQLESIESAQTRKYAKTKTVVEKVGEQPPPKKGELGAPLEPVKVDQTGLTGGSISSVFPKSRIINLLRVPGPQQVLLKVQVAELNRSALREIGADLFFANQNGSSLVGTQIGGASVNASANGAEGIITNAATLFGTSPTTTVFGIFEKEFAMMIRALRRNSVLKILAEPNLVAMNGHTADFLAGGEFPVPIPQTSTGGAGTSVTVQFKEFGVKLAFLPHILDGGVIRLKVAPEVSSIDFAIGTVLVPGGTPVPGLNTRKANTTVELREGQTLAIAGLLQVTLDGQTSRIPGLGDLPILGPFFSNTTGNRIEKEMIVLVTPYLVDSLRCDQVPPLPGAEVNAPNDLEFYLGNRIEGRTGRDWRATTGNYASAPALLPSFLRLHTEYVRGPHGFSD
jgi:pilus assembly protein CpaC